MVDRRTSPRAVAYGHVMDARARVAKQRQLVHEIKERGGDSESARKLLAEFEQSLSNCQDNLAVIVGRGEGMRRENVAARA